MQNQRSTPNFRKRFRAYAASGFTLIEVMIVVTLLAIIGTMVTTNLMGRLKEGKQKSTKIVMRQIQSALDDFYRTCSFYPNTTQGLQALIEKPTSGPDCKNYDPTGYLKGNKIPNDAWDRAFIYVNDDGSEKFTLKSLGSDGKDGGASYDQDLDISDPNF